MPTLGEIETLTKTFSEARDVVRDRVQELKDEIEVLKRRRLRGIRNAVQKAAAAHEDLWQAIDGSREMFVKPKSMVLFGVKIGLQKGKGGLNWEDDAKVCELIAELFEEDQAKLLIKVTKKPIEAALKELDDDELKKIGVRSEPGTDIVLIKPVDGEVDKQVNAMLKAAVDTEAEEEAA